VTTAPRLLPDYDPALTRTSLSALVELALALASYRDSLVLVGGWNRLGGVEVGRL